MRPDYLGHRRRLKASFQRSPRGLSDYELLELLLGYGLPRKDTKPLAKRLLGRFGTLPSVLNASSESLQEVDGFGPGLSVFFQVLHELRARQEQGLLQGRDILSSPDRVARMARARLGRLQREEFWLALVDNKNRLFDFVQLSFGTVDQTAVYPREVMRLAISRQASGIVLVHNHPGGDPRPSAQDKELTGRIRSAATELGIRVLDHVIVCEEGFFSFQTSNLL